MRKETCDGCVYFEESPIITNGGLCHCNPPTVMLVVTKEGPRPGGSTFPPTLKTSWCGRWKKGNLIKVSNKMPPEPIPFGVN